MGDDSGIYLEVTECNDYEVHFDLSKEALQEKTEAGCMVFHISTDIYHAISIFEVRSPDSFVLIGKKFS